MARRDQRDSEEYKELIQALRGAPMKIMFGVIAVAIGIGFIVTLFTS